MTVCVLCCCCLFVLFFLFALFVLFCFLFMVLDVQDSLCKCGKSCKCNSLDVFQQHMEKEFHGQIKLNMNGAFACCFSLLWFFL